MNARRIGRRSLHAEDLAAVAVRELTPFIAHIYDAPFIKKAIVSGQAAHHDITAWLLDGMSNHGFSGGPVIIQEQESEGYRIFGVVSPYVPANVPVSPAIVEAAAPGQVGVAPPSPDDPVFETNSGLMIAFDILHAVQTIDAWLGSHPPE
jgi:hypothetical protein